MSLLFWIKRFLAVFLGIFIILLAINLVKGKPLAPAAAESALWAGISTVVFTATRFYRSRQGEQCELCGDTPALQPDARAEPKNTSDRSCLAEEKTGPRGTGS